MWFFSAKCTSNTLLIGKTAIITGGNTGIGKETAKDFYKRGARVIIACRNIEKANEAVEDIKKQCASQEQNLGTIVVQQLDLNNLSLVKQCAQQLMESEKRIDLLINNAGIMITPNRFTEDGFESHFGVNHLGHFLFTLLLLPRIIESTPARIVNVSSVAHERGAIDFEDLSFERKTFQQIPAYAQSKLANILFTKELANKLNEQGIQGVTVYSLHPGVIRTELGRNINILFPGMKFLWNIFGRWAIKTPEQGAQTTIHCAVDEEAGTETGLYYRECKVTKPSNNAEDINTAKKL